MSLGRAPGPEGKGPLPVLVCSAARRPSCLSSTTAPRAWWVTRQSAPKATATKHELGPGCEGTVHFRCFPTPGDTWALGVITGDYLGRDFPL